WTAGTPSLPHDTIKELFNRALLLHKPLHETRHAFFDGHAGFVAEQPTRLRNICIRDRHIARLWRLVFDARFLADGAFDDGDQLIDRNGSTIAQIENLK